MLTHTVLILSSLLVAVILYAAVASIVEAQYPERPWTWAVFFSIVGILVCLINTVVQLVWTIVILIRLIFK